MSFEYAGFISGIFEQLKEDLIAKIIAGVLAALLLPVFWWTFRKLKKWFRCCRQVADAGEAISPSGKGIWLSKPPCPPEKYRLKLAHSIPILTIANLKGGVGKTTLAANLTAAFAAQASETNDKPILAIDLDFQGSLSSMMLSDAQRLPGERMLSKASKLIDGERDGAWLLGEAQPVANAPNAWCIPAYYDLASTENRAVLPLFVAISS